MRDSDRTHLDRRAFLKLAAACGAGAAFGSLYRQARAAGVGSAPQLVRFPEKTDLILLTDRPPQLETPVKFFAHDLTPNDAFFVRWHVAGIPTAIDIDAFRLSVGGHVE